jgi:hypothetical protein
MKRKWKDADVYLFFNEGAQPCIHKATLLSRGHTVQTWNAQTGRIESVPSTRKAGNVEVHLNLQPYEARVIVVR